MLGLRWFIARWEKGKKKWWMDWDRAGEGLERDIKETLTTVLDEKVLSVPLRAAEALGDMVKVQRQETAKVNEELDYVSLEGSQTQTVEAIKEQKRS